MRDSHLGRTMNIANRVQSAPTSITVDSTRPDIFPDIAESEASVTEAPTSVSVNQASYRDIIRQTNNYQEAIMERRRSVAETLSSLKLSADLRMMELIDDLQSFDREFQVRDLANQVMTNDDVECVKAVQDMQKVLILDMRQNMQAKIDLWNNVVVEVTKLMSIRYINQRTTLPKCTQWLADILPSYPDDKFTLHCRVTRHCFGVLVHILESSAHDLFHKKKGPKQNPVSVQLYIYMQSVGFYGNHAAPQVIADINGFSLGFVINCRRRVSEAFFSMRSRVIKWPEEEERAALCDIARRRWGFPNCFFVIDGTTHPLCFQPSLDPVSYYDRKSRYSIHALICSDHRKKIISAVVGWPGSVHDAKVLSTMEFMDESKKHLYFTGNQHGLGDAAFGPSIFVIPTYKAPQTQFTENVDYNGVHSSCRVSSEHVNGMVKGRFQGMREIRIVIKKDEDILEIIKLIVSTYVVHNLLVEMLDNFWEVAQEDGFDTPASLGHIYDTGSQEYEDDVSLTASQRGTLFRERVKTAVLQARGMLGR